MFLSNSDCLKYAQKAYLLKAASEDEFLEDFARFKYVKKLINRYLEGEDLQGQKIYNHLRIMKNVFDSKLILKLFEDRYNLRQMMVLKPFLLLIGYINIYEYSEIPLDSEAVEACRKIKNVS